MKKRNDFLKDPKFNRPKREKPEWGEPKDESPAPQRPAKAGGKKKYTRLSEAFPELGEGKKPRAKAEPKARRDDDPKPRRRDDREEKKESTQPSSARPARERDEDRKPRRADSPKPRRDDDRPEKKKYTRLSSVLPSLDRDDERKPRRDDSGPKSRPNTSSDRIFNKPTLKRSDLERLRSSDYKPKKFERNRHDDSPPPRDADRPPRRADRAERGPRRDIKSSDAFRSRREESDDDRPSRRDDQEPRRDDFRSREGGSDRRATRGPRSERPERGGERFNPRVDRREREEREKKSTEGESRRVGKFSRPPRYDFSDYEGQKPKSRTKKEFKKHDDDDVLRLNRYIANAGICSRREADELIASGQITVNGETVTEMGFRVKRSDAVKYGKKLLNPEKMVYLLINKPKDHITTTDDPDERRTVMDLVAGACEERIYPVGRLDRNTTGLLLLTNDGELAKKLTHPSSEIKKIYQVELDKPITEEDFEKLKEGLELEDGFVKPDDLSIVTPDAMVVGIEIHSGKNRVVRRLFEHLGYEVQKLDRTVFAGLNKKDLPRGKWRFLSEKEVIKLKFLL